VEKIDGLRASDRILIGSIFLKRVSQGRRERGGRRREAGGRRRNERGTREEE
jgi:hypothetical protein